jgi:hypothetical protein
VCGIGHMGCPIGNKQFDTPPSSLMDSTMSPKVKTTEGEGDATRSLARTTLGVEGHAGVSGRD